MAKLLSCLVFASVAVTLVTAGAFQFPWEKDQEIRENSFQEQGEPAVAKHENHKDFIGSMMRRIFGKSENPNQSHLRLARAAVAEVMVGAAQATAKTTVKTTVKTTTTPRPTQRTTNRATTKKPTTRRPGSGASALETSTLATVVLAFSAVCLQWVLHR